MSGSNSSKSQIFMDLILGSLVLLLATLLSPILLTAFLVLMIWRYFVCTLALLCVKDCDGPIFGHDTLFVTDNFYKKPHSVLPGLSFLFRMFSFTVKIFKFYLLVLGAIILSGKPDITNIWDHFSRVLGKRRSDNTLVYDNLLQYPIQFMGFCFWKWDTDFNIQVLNE